MLLRALFSLLLLLQAVSGFFPGTMLWGVNHLAYAPLAVRLLWPIAGILLIWTPLHAVLGRWLTDRIAPHLLGRRLVAYAIAPAAGAFLYWVLRCRTHFLGDGYLLGESIFKGRVFHGFDLLDYHLHEKLFDFLGLQARSDSFQCFAAVSVVAGAFYLVASAWSARSLSADGGNRILLYAMLVFFAPVQMFMGYVECYAILMVLMLLFITTVLLYYRQRSPAWVPAALYGAGLAFHLDALFLAPLLVAILFYPAEQSRDPFVKRLASVAGPVLAALGLAAGIYLLGGYDRAVFEVDFSQLREGQRLVVSILGPHGLLSWHHWKDIFNLALLLVPVPLILLLTSGLQGKRTTRHRRELGVLLAGCLWLTILIALIHMKLGIARDWDLFAAQMPIFVLTAFLLWSDRTQKQTDVARITTKQTGSERIGLVVVTALFLSMPWFWLNAGAERSLQRFRDIIDDMPNFSRAYAHEEVARYFRDRGMIPEAYEEYRTCVEIFPDNARFHMTLGLLQYNDGNQDAALQTFLRGLSIDPTNWSGLEMVARIHAKRNEFDKALPYARQLAGRPEERSKAAETHGEIAEHLGLLDEAILAYIRAGQKSPQERSDLLERMGKLAIRAGDIDTAEDIFRELLRRQPSSVLGRAGLAAALWLPLRENPAGRQTPSSRTRLLEALHLLDSLIAEGKATEEARRQHQEIRAALDRK